MGEVGEVVDVTLAGGSHAVGSPPLGCIVGGPSATGKKGLLPWPEAPVGSATVFVRSSVRSVGGAGRHYEWNGQRGKTTAQVRARIENSGAVDVLDLEKGGW